MFISWEGKNIVKGVTQVSGHSLKLHFCMYEKSQMKTIVWIVMCNPYKKMFTLAPFAPLNVFSPVTPFHNKSLFNGVIFNLRWLSIWRLIFKLIFILKTTKYHFG
jgi:hypothetical protein